MNTTGIYHFNDDGVIPNNSIPVVVYRKVYDYHHYHSNTYEVLGVYSGTAVLQLGGESGKQLEVHAGDVLILPAGTGHKSVHHSKDFSVVGAYPDGKEPDLIRLEDKRPEGVREKIDLVAIPGNDPVYSQSADGLLKFGDE